MRKCRVPTDCRNARHARVCPQFSGSTLGRVPHTAGTVRVVYGIWPSTRSSMSLPREGDVSHQPGKRLRAWTASVAAHGCRGLPVPGICGVRIPDLAGEVAGRRSVSSRPPSAVTPLRGHQPYPSLTHPSGGLRPGPGRYPPDRHPRGFRRSASAAWRPIASVRRPVVAGTRRASLSGPVQRIFWIVQRMFGVG